jgi:hypothetical protein
VQTIRATCKSPVAMLLLAGSVRNAGGYSWSYNVNQYYEGVYNVSKDYIAQFMSWIPLVAGSFGALSGGALSDLVYRKWLVGSSQRARFASMDPHCAGVGRPGCGCSL